MMPSLYHQPKGAYMWKKLLLSFALTIPMTATHANDTVYKAYECKIVNPSGGPSARFIYDDREHSQVIDNQYEIYLRRVGQAKPAIQVSIFTPDTSYKHRVIFQVPEDDSFQFVLGNIAYALNIVCSVTK